MKKNLMLVLILAFVVSMVPLFAEDYYKDKQKIQWMTSIANNTYRTLTVQHVDSWQGKSEDYVDQYGETHAKSYWAGSKNPFGGATFDNFFFGNTQTAGDPNIVEILAVFKQGDKLYDKNAKQWKKGEKTTVATIEKDRRNVSDFRIKTPNGFFIEFTGWNNNEWWTSGDKNRRFGIILPLSVITFQTSTDAAGNRKGLYLIMHPGSSIGWDNEFKAVSKVEDCMEYLSYMADYSEQKKDVDARLQKLSNNKENVKNELINAVRNREVIYGTLAGGLPPLIGYPQDVDFIMKNSYRVPLVCSLGILYGRYNNEKGVPDVKTFNRLFKYDLYVLFAGKDSSGNFLVSASVDVGTEALAKLAEDIATDYGLKNVAKAVPIVGTLWGMGKGAIESNSEIQKFVKDAVDYYTKSANVEEFQTDQSGKLVNYNGTGKSVTIPDNVKIIGNGAFKNKPITSVTIGKNVTTIEVEAFLNCSSLTTVTIPSNTPLSSIKANAFRATNLNESSKKALRKWYTGEGVGKGASGVTFQNNTGVEINIIERKNGSNWATVSPNSLKTGSKIEGVNLAPGTYDLRVRAGGVFPNTTIFQKNGVKVEDGTTVIFTKENKYAITRGEYQTFIQARCNFSNVNDVWKAMNTHPNADDLYRMWAESYPSGSAPPPTRPAGKTDQVIIVEKCNFKTPQAVWDAAAKHKDSKSLLKKWADSYYRK
jgi:hypothetical protein